MKIRFIGESVDKYEHLIVGGIYTLKGNDIWVIDGDDGFVIVRGTAEEIFKNFEIAN